MKYLPPRYLFRRAALLRELRAGRSFLEVGAGDLTFTDELLNLFETGTSIEPNADLSPFAAKLPWKKQRRLTVESVGLDSFKTSQRFSCVAAFEVLEHVADDQSFVDTIFELLEPGGQIALSVPARMKWWTVHDQIVGHLRRYERQELEALLKASGFDDVAILAYGYPWVNLLRYPRLILAKQQSQTRLQWDTDQQTAESNHRQIPSSLSSSPIRFLLQPWLVAPLAHFSRLFHSTDRSDGYIVLGTRP